MGIGAYSSVAIHRVHEDITGLLHRATRCGKAAAVTDTMSANPGFLTVQKQQNTRCKGGDEGEEGM